MHNLKNFYLLVNLKTLVLVLTFPFWKIFSSNCSIIRSHSLKAASGSLACGLGLVGVLSMGTWLPLDFSVLFLP